MNTTELKIAADKANTLFTRIKEKYPKLAGHLVYSSPQGQCNLTTNMPDILKAFPAMIVDSRQKEKALGVVQSIVSLEKEKKNDSGASKGNLAEKIKQLKSELSPLIGPLDLRDDTFVEIRFDEKKVNLPLIYELQKDELVSQAHTPQSKASVRIVLGTLRDLQ